MKEIPCPKYQCRDIVVYRFRNQIFQGEINHARYTDQWLYFFKIHNEKAFYSTVEEKDILYKC